MRRCRARQADVRGWTWLDLDEHWRELIQKDDHPVTVTSLNPFAPTPELAHCRDRGPQLNPRDFQVRDLPDRIAETAQFSAGCKLAATPSARCRNIAWEFASSSHWVRK